ncbi:MAG: hypothetical protein JXQ83_06360 [Candidatus Glassbacteria bacterium]|nr:hypothetical protein [Candidatus Glassbacteria bacterium]
MEMTIFEENESLLDTLEGAEAKVEKIKIDGVDSVDEQARNKLALEIKTVVSRLVANVAAGDGDAEALGGALVLMDLIEVFKRYLGIFDIPGMDEQIASLEKMWEEAQ